MGQISRRLIGGLALLMLTTAAWSAEEPDLDVTFKAGWDNCYRPERWTPLSFIVVSKQKKPLAVRLSVFGQQDSMTNMTIDHDFVVTPDVPANVPMVTRLLHDHNYNATIQADKVRAVRWNNQMGTASFADNSSLSLEPIAMQDLFVGLCGTGTTGLVRLSDHLTVENRSPNGRSGLHVKEKVLNLLPWDWAGYDCLDLMILHDAEWNQMNDYQARAIVAWVNNGGKLLLVLGSHPLPRDHVLAKMLPFAIGPAQDVPLSRAQVLEWDLQRSTRRNVTCWTLPAAKGWKALTVNGDVRYFCRGLVGFGTVGVLGFSPTELAGTEPAASFWREILREFDARCGPWSGENENANANYSEPSPYVPGDMADSANAVLAHLQSIPEMRPLSIWWIIALLSVLALVLGPLDYFVLKKLDRLPMTWITSTAVIVLFSVGAYFGVEKIRGGLMQVRAVTVIDAVQGQPNSCWSTTMCGIFAPSSDSYRLAGPKGNQWWSALSPESGQPGPYSYGRSYPGYDHQEATRNIYCSQQDGGNIPSALPINIWSMQHLRVESQSLAFPFNAKVELGEQYHLKITLENHSDDAITDGFVRVSFPSDPAAYYMRIDGVPPHSTKVFTGSVMRSDDPLSSWPSNIISAFRTQGVLPRTDAINEYHAQGAVVILARYMNAPAPFQVEGRKGNTNHIQLARLVVPHVAPAE